MTRAACKNQDFRTAYQAKIYRGVVHSDTLTGGSWKCVHVSNTIYHKSDWFFDCYEAYDGRPRLTIYRLSAGILGTSGCRCGAFTWRNREHDRQLWNNFNIYWNSLDIYWLFHPSAPYRRNVFAA